MRVNPSICNQGPKTQTIQTKHFLAKNPSTTQQTIPLKPSTTHAKPLLSSPAEGSKPSRKDDVQLLLSSPALQLSSPAIQLSSPAAKQATCPAVQVSSLSVFSVVSEILDEMPSAIGEYMSMMLFESDEDQDQPHEDESDEGADLEEDDLVDEENNVPEVEVDMADFTLNLDGDESNTDGGVADEEIDEDLDVIDNERWDSLDEGSDDDMRRRNVLKNLAKEKRCNLGNVHKASFYVGQKFKSKKELKDLIDDHAIQTRRNLYFEKNDKLRLRAKCRGVVVGSLCFHSPNTIRWFFPIVESPPYGAPRPSTRNRELMAASSAASPVGVAVLIVVQLIVVRIDVINMLMELWI
ncbi:hypothetical protein LXL04_028367 [Taraxacum kok-saghyz]